MDTSPDKATVSTAHCLRQRICSLNFLLCLAVSETFLGLTHHLSVYLQSPAMDMSVAFKQVDLVLTKLEEMGTNAEEEFHKIFSLCQDRAVEFGVKCEIPRVVGTVRLAEQYCIEYQANYRCSFAEDYYRRATFIPYVDDLKASLKRRFANHRKTLQILQFVLPKHASKGKFEPVQPAFDFYLRDMTTTHILTLKGEWEIRKTKWQAMQEEELPRFATDALAECDKDLLPNVHALLKILAMLPVTTAAAERSFSTLKRVKTYLTNRTAEERLNGLALMPIHRMQVSVDEVIAVFMEKPRRLKIAA
ncbi:hypothetical protein HPB48_024581 [Haemaphysalis longicornis]|uniref:HAT C-terminal dimerisation domain-containing protein n=1 Tax=Haemaphysalis longicornis TaxID=44386 RepID=A0A9J6H8F2_HAELO|nr:hypothetical protein HPB48_024581 [Haemaphysalis longicornis]